MEVPVRVEVPESVYVNVLEELAARADRGDVDGRDLDVREHLDGRARWSVEYVLPDQH